MKRAELIEKWLEALESGEYKQGKGSLLEDGKYCCLGVACEVAKQNGISTRFRGKGYLPQKISKLLKITEDGSFEEYVVHRGRTFESLARLNDGGVRFTTIARIIREQMAKNNFAKP